jgi:serine/threonine-protein kinase
MIGQKLGPYEVLAKLGEGGMGEVYRARDTRLKRDVAIKVLPDGLATETERLARFHREAELLASLNHPNIAAIYGVEEFRSGGSSDPPITGLVLELIEGETLADRLARGPIRFSDAMAIARQLVEAFDAAHGKNVIHRDLKPANIKITPDDKVKVLDFGLAAVVQSSSVQDINVTHSPTLTLNATRAGVILGTAAYMSPEQATGSAADKRADVWAFGVVLWEMLTGRRIFEGETVSHTLAFVITKEPDWTVLPSHTPPSIRRLLRRCLEKDRKRRLPDIASAQMEIDDAVTTSSTDVGATSPAPPISQSRWQRALPWAFGVFATIALAVVVALWAPWRIPPPLTPVRVAAELGVDALIGSPGAPSASLALSPDGRLLAFVAGPSAGGPVRLYIRRLDQLQATALSGTESARDPFFSPDGETSTFWVKSVDVLSSTSTGAIVAFGDSITDGTCSTLDGHDRWEDVLAMRLAFDASSRGSADAHRAVVNEGIGGNTITREKLQHARARASRSRRLVSPRRVTRRAVHGDQRCPPRRNGGTNHRRHRGHRQAREESGLEGYWRDDDPTAQPASSGEQHGMERREDPGAQRRQPVDPHQGPIRCGD